MRVPLPIRVIPALAWRAWLTPPPIGRSTRERDAAAAAAHRRITVAGHEAIEVGAGPAVLAVHGWGGRTAQFLPLAERLADEGFRVVIPAFPGHAGGAPTDVKQVARAVREAADEIEAAAVVGHSFAGITMRLAFSDGAPGPVVLLAPLVRVRHALAVFGARLRLLPWTRWRLRRRLERWDPALWPVVDGSGGDQLPGGELLVLHDPRDEDTPFSAAAEMAARRPRTRIVAADGVGHAGILTDRATIDAAARHVRTHAFHLPRAVGAD